MSTPEQNPGGEIVLYQTSDEQTRIEVRLQDETVWLTQKLMSELFQKDVRTINEHLQNIFEEGELAQDSVIRKFRITAADGKTYETQHYNLDVVISVGYRVTAWCLLYRWPSEAESRFWSSPTVFLRSRVRSRKEGSSLVEAGGTVFDTPISTETEVSVTPS